MNREIAVTAIGPAELFSNETVTPREAGSFLSKADTHTHARGSVGSLKRGWLREFQNWHHPKNHEYDGEINETWDNYFSGTA